MRTYLASGVLDTEQIVTRRIKARDEKSAKAKLRRMVKPGHKIRDVKAHVVSEDSNR